MQTPNYEYYITDDGEYVKNPLAEPIKRNSDSSSYSWCTCSESICYNQLGGTVAWVGISPENMHEEYE